MLDQRQGAVDRERFLEKVVGTELSGAHCGLDRAVTRDHDDFGRLLEFSDSLESVQAIHAGKPHIKQDDVEGLLFNQGQAEFSGFRFDGLVTFILEHALERVADARFVVHDQDVMHAVQWER
jgi:hypothetical protein